MESPLSREPGRRWLLALGCFAILIFFFSPSWAAFRAWSRVPALQGLIEVRRGASVLQQLAHPGAAIADPLHAAIQWRLLFPFIGHVLHLPPTLVFGLSHLGCALVLAFVIALLRRHGWTWPETALATLVFGAAEWFFAATGWLGYFDAWLVFAVLIVAFARHWWAVWLACLWAPWVDERFALALPLALACRHVYLTRHPPAPASVTRRTETVVALSLLAVFLVIRFALLSGRTATGATVSGYLAAFAVADAPLGRMALGMWEGLRAGWIFAAAAVVLLWRRQRNAAVMLLVLAVASGGIGLLTAQDFGRSMMLLTPLALLGLLLTREANASWRPLVLRAGAVVTLLLPAHHVMSDRVNPIYYLYHEIAAFESPPPAVMPELHELRGIDAMQRGDFVEAAEALSMAIQLSPNPARASRQRGILFASAQRWAEARQDFATSVEHEPKNPDGWFLRAQAELALGNTRAAESDWTQARSLASPKWAERADVARFQARLKK
ncbi:MAG TPA: tetratricopeptide repeat protein [Opitutaceae bacterium]|nr:tetratricopeptide repeat protein [Opitutaceae bacterium]